MPYRHYKTLPNALRHYRQRQQFKMYELAQMLELTGPAHLSHWERGKSAPSLENLLKLSILLNVPVSSLYFDLYKQLRQDLANKYPHLKHLQL